MKKKQQKPTRKRDWAHDHEDAFTHDLKRHRKAEAAGLTRPLPPLPPEQVVLNAVVIGHVGHYAFLHMDGQERLCLIDPALGVRTSSVLASGDEVMVEDIDGQGVVRAIGPRRTKLSRLAHLHSDVVEQVIAANVDLLVVVAAAAQPRFKPGLVDRYLIAADAGGLETVLVINKMDLVDEEPEKVRYYREFGLRVFNTSCESGRGLDELRQALQGRLSVFAGHSGVGKSSLLNSIAPELDVLTQEVSASTEKGKHTTSAARLYQLANGIRIIDTPGVRSIGLWNIDSYEVHFYFPEIAEKGMDCRFRDCRHLQEPGCAVIEAVEQGAISKLRYESYKRIRQDLREKQSY